MHTLKYVYIHPYVVFIEIFKKDLYLGMKGVDVNNCTHLHLVYLVCQQNGLVSELLSPCL